VRAAVGAVSTTPALLCAGTLSSGSDL